MPELPDLQVFSYNLNKTLKGKKVKSINAVIDKKLNVSKATLKQSLEQQSIKKVFRDGKELHIEFGNKEILGLHLMLHGELHLFEGKNEHKHTILEIYFDDDTGLALNDWQGMATPTLNPEVKPAPDALSDKITFEFLQEKLNRKRTTIKIFLLDQKIIRGIGNAYADEILWDARISPFSTSNKIPDEKIRALVKSIKHVLSDAEKQISKENPERIAGELRDFLLIHNSKKTKSPTNSKIKIEKAGSRKTYYTDEQELFK